MRYLEILNEQLNIPLTAQRFGPALRNRLLGDRSAEDTFVKMKPEKSSDGRPPMLLKNIPFTDEQIIEFLAQYDPTPQKKYFVNWIIPKYLDKGINLFEDLPGVKQDLQEFDQYKHKMSIKDIFQIKNAVQLSQIVIQALRPEGSIGEIPPNEVKAAYGESIIVHENEKYIVVIPKTQRAAGFWGRNTSWCTAYGYRYGRYPKRNSLYNNYSGEGFLIFFDKEPPDEDDGANDSFQCYYGQDRDDVQIMDWEDENIIGESYVIKAFKDITSVQQIQLILNNCFRDYTFKIGGSSVVLSNEGYILYANIYHDLHSARSVIPWDKFETILKKYEEDTQQEYSMTDGPFIVTEKMKHENFFANHFIIEESVLELAKDHRPLLFG